MPKNTDPKSLVRVSTGANRPSQVINNLSSQVTIREGAYEASEISSDNPYGTYLGHDVQSHLNEITGSVLNPPRLGQPLQTYTNQDGISATHTGYPDWGVLKQVDTPVWSRQDTDVQFLDGSTIPVERFASFSDPSDVFFYNVQNGFFPNEQPPAPDPIFNTGLASGIGALSGYGQGSTFLCSKTGLAFDPTANPLSSRDFPLRLANTLDFNYNSDRGFTISGLLFPADRGTVALLHWIEGGFNLTPATSVTDIQNRVVAAINLDGGIQGDSIFIEGSGTDFPSRISGQYDLYEMQTGTYRTGLTQSGAIPTPPFTPSQSLGAVRLLKDPNAAYFGDGVSVTDPRGHLPVLFGSHFWDGASWQQQEANFLSYRLPTKADYSPESLDTPREHRARFFKPVTLHNPDYSVFETAGNYVTFGEDRSTHQVARYRHVAKYSGFANAISQVGADIFLGSFALVHFKTEDAFEKLVRDGIAPTSDDLWSVSLFNYDDAGDDQNVVGETSTYSSTGESLSSAASINAESFPLIRPSVVLSSADSNRLIPTLDSDGATNLYANTVIPEARGAYSYGVFDRQEHSYMSVSGVKYILPRGGREVSFRTSSNEKDRWTLPYSNMMLSVTIPEFNLGTAFYSDSEGVVNYDYNTPFNPAMINLSPITGEAGVQGQLYNESLNTVVSVQGETQRLEISKDMIDPSGDSRVLDLFPEGDLGFCVFSEGVWTSFLARDPFYHKDSYPLAKMLVASTSEDSTQAPVAKMLYHSSGLLSLVERLEKATWYGYFGVNSTFAVFGFNARFSIFRFDEEGFRVYQKIQILNNSLLGVYSSYHDQAYLKNTTVVPFQSDSPDFSVDLYNGVTYYVEFNYATTVATGVIDLALVPPFYEQFRTIDPAVFSNFITQVTFDPFNAVEVNILSSKFKYHSFEVLEAPDTVNVSGTDYNVLPSESFTDILAGAPAASGSPFSAKPLSDLRLDLEKVRMEVPKVDGTHVPTYGNFTEDRLGVISVQGMSDPTNSTMAVKTWDDPTQPLRRKPLSSLFTARKDTQERFLDESYRIHISFNGFDQATRIEEGWDASLQDDLQGTPANPQKIDFFVRDDSPTTEDYNSNHSAAGYLRNGLHWYKPVQGQGYVEAQVKGLPPLESSLSSVSKYGQPRRGMLGLFNTDYDSAPYFPNYAYGVSWSDNNSTNPPYYYNQPQDALLTEGSFLYFMRAFDLAFSRSGVVEEVSSDSSFKLRIYGVPFHGYLHTPELFSGNRGVQVLVKVPGLTGWLDAGVTKGHTGHELFGLDGCLLGAREGYSVDEGVIFTDLEVGFDTKLFANRIGEVTVLIVVGIINNDIGRSLNFGATDPASTPIHERRGILGVEVLRKSTGQNYDNDAVVYTKDIDVFSALPQSEVGVIEDGAEAEILPYNLRFSISTGGSVAVSFEYMMLYRVTSNNPTLEEGLGIVEAEIFAGYTSYFDAVVSTEPSYTRVYSLELVNNVAGIWVGYFKDVPPGDYALLVVTEMDENVDPEFNVAFTSRIGTPSFTDSPFAQSGDFTNLLQDPSQGHLGGARYFAWNLTIANTGVVIPTFIRTDLLTANLTSINSQIQTISEITGEVLFFIVDLSTGNLVSLNTSTNPNWSVQGKVASYSPSPDTSYSDDDQGTISLTFSLQVGRNYKFVYESLNYGNSMQVRLGGGLYEYSEVLTQPAPHRYEHYAFVDRTSVLIYQYVAEPVS